MGPQRSRLPGFRVGIVGATGTLATELLAVLSERLFPVESLLPIATDQSLGARLAATEGPARQGIIVEHQRFERGNLDDLENAMRSWAGKVSGVVVAS